MADGDRANMIDGFASVQAVRRAKPRGEDPKYAPSRSRLPGSGKKAPAKKSGAPAPHVGRTALPPRFDILCYACGYRFVLTGRMGDSVLCSKCREALLTKDYTLDRPWSEPVKTVGTVVVAPGAVLSAVKIVARRVRVAADTGQAEIECQDLEMDKGGTLDLGRATFRDLFVGEKARCSFSRVVACRKIEVRGRLTAKVRAEESVSIRVGGMVRGEIVTPRLAVEDGAGLSARLAIGTESRNVKSEATAAKRKTGVGVTQERPRKAVRGKARK